MSVGQVKVKCISTAAHEKITGEEPKCFTTKAKGSNNKKKGGKELEMQ